MRKLWFLVLWVLPMFTAHGTQLDTLRHLNIKPNGGYSAIWGYTAPNGREYAIVGLNGSGGQPPGISIVDITDVNNLRSAALISGPASSWREMKTYKQYAYVVSEASSGVQIIDLAPLPDTARLVRAFNYTSGSKNILKNHTITISDGYMYLNGSANWPASGQTGGGGVVIFSLLGDPTLPQYVGEYQPAPGSGNQNANYIHDCYVRNDTLFGAAVYSTGGLYIANVANKANPQTIGKIIYANSGTHNSWTTKDRRYVITTDEIGNTAKNLKVWDVQNLPTVPTNPVTTFTATPADIVHNITIRGDYAYVAWYTAGVRVANVTNPTNLTDAGGYDTSTQPAGSYNGVWGIYPYFPSGKIVAGDMQNGLWVFSFSDLAPRVPVTLQQPQHGDSLGVGLPIMFRWTKSADLNKDPHYYNVHLIGPGIDTMWRSNDSVSVFSDVGRLQVGGTYAWSVITRDEFNETPSPSSSSFGYGGPAQILLVALTSPTGGESWQYGSFHNITWTSALVDFVDISYETSGAGPWITIAEFIPASAGTIEWTIPNAPTTTARIRIASTIDPLIDSSNTFSITVPSISSNPSSMTFGDVGAGQSLTDTLRIQNTGTAPLTISNISSDSAAFSVSRTSLVIAAGDADTISVTFNPTEIQFYASTLRITSNTPTSPTNISLSGNGVQPSSVEEHKLPTTYNLEQCYPNPFNPAATIRYSLPEAGPVTMKVYNTLGEEVATLVDHQQNAGTYTVSFDASGFASGLYFYRITAGKFSETRKMLLIK